MNIEAFIKKHGIHISNVAVDINPNNKEWTEANHYRCVLRMGKKHYTTYFSMGYAHTSEPTVADVLDCLAMDSEGIDNSDSFEGWASYYGYDTDSRKAEKTYQVCLKQAEKLENFLGTENYKTLLYKVDRL